MNVADLPGVEELTEAGGCQVLWMAPEMSLQYGVTVRGAAVFTLSSNSLIRSAGNSFWICGSW